MSGYVLGTADAALDAALRALLPKRLVFFAGLPATGKSLLIHQLAHLAAAEGREVHLLQSDVARPVFEASEAGRLYPVIDGVTQPVIRQAVGLWARAAVGVWSRAHDSHSMLIGEAPLIGGRLVQLARPGDDEAEAALSAPDCSFVLPVPSNEVRRHIEDERARTTIAPRDQREREDAPPHVLRQCWEELLTVGARMGLDVNTWTKGTPSYESRVYQTVYERLLRHRRTEVLPIEAVLPVEGLSVYRFEVGTHDVAPSVNEVARYISEAEVEERELGSGLLIDRWWDF